MRHCICSLSAQARRPVSPLVARVVELCAAESCKRDSAAPENKSGSAEVAPHFRAPEEPIDSAAAPSRHDLAAALGSLEPGRRAAGLALSLRVGQCDFTFRTGLRETLLFCLTFQSEPNQ